MITKSDRTVGLIGLGIMGYAMSKNLLAAGFTVVGYDISPRAIESFRANGGTAAGSVAEVGKAAGVLITSLPSAKALFDVVAELRTLDRRERVLAETSTFTLEDKSKAHLLLGEKGITMLDCPLSGSGSQALERDVLVYGSGERSAYDRCLPVFEGFSRAPHYLGPFGNGSKMKYVANLMVAVHTAVAGEAFALARKAGLDPAQTYAVVSDGAAGSRALAVRGQMLIEDNYETIRTMPLELWRKDMKVIADFAGSLACPTPMFSAAVPLFNAAVASGYGAQDTAAVAAVIEAMAGLPTPKK
ncbi:NAD(P)-dependent oxidoreductase [Bradyrhizobium sp. GCM10027634]|uniref:NAD(P)-dependent oxidoreductase n=1 Tax=unclassified Bradyrhizobium TaxID=2631580 RepID=UPI00188A10AF|nr:MULTISPECIES: NAD(P)-dependent oxidoreductase [unclassified Bradyrhizobium]MDN5005700.1 NAD(P)-dependent oxidoreductase [Bradyrhizobium sp. WYCCWR 12677]QOZ44527.1 NAD(P)-dependent oxidoreductase [Bradyrhizobium sp. CCBAU 53340]